MCLVLVNSVNLYRSAQFNFYFGQCDLKMNTVFGHFSYRWSLKPMSISVVHFDLVCLNLNQLMKM